MPNSRTLARIKRGEQHVFGLRKEVAANFHDGIGVLSRQPAELKKEEAIHSVRAEAEDTRRELDRVLSSSDSLLSSLAAREQRLS